MRLWLVVLAAAALGCARARTQVRRDEDFSLARYRKIAVAPFIDERGQGRAIAQSLTRGLAALPHSVAPPSAVERFLAARGPAEESLGLETLERLRAEAGVDAVVLGRTSPDWSSVSLLLYETELGDPMLRAVLRPRAPEAKAFASADEVAAEALKAIVGR